MPDAWRGILFDLDGTLVDSEGRNLWSLRGVAEDRGIRLTAGELDWLGEATWDACFEFLRERYREWDPESSRRVFERLLRSYREDPPPAMPGAGAAVSASRAVAPVGIVTASGRGLAEALLAGHPGLGPWSVVVTGEDRPATKPSPDPYLEATRLLRADPASCLAFEDGFAGADSATAAGLCVCRVGSRFQDKMRSGHPSLDNLGSVDGDWLREVWRNWRAAQRA